MRVAVIGGSGRIGTYLVPRLVADGHAVQVVARGTSGPRRDHPAWDAVERVALDRAAAEADGTFGARVAALRPDAVIDLVCYEPESVGHLLEHLRPLGTHLLVAGTHWVHGPSAIVPTPEDVPRRPLCAYGRKKAGIEELCLAETRGGGLAATVLHLGHVVSPSDRPVNPVGNKDPAVFGVLARGEELAVPNLGMETLHHVHADDVAQAFVRALARRDAAAGESFHVAAPWAVTMRGYAEEAARWFGREARLRFVPWPAWREGVDAKWAGQTWEHLAHSPNASIAKARRLLGYEPRYTSFDAVREALAWLVEHGRVPGVGPGDWA